MIADDDDDSSASSDSSDVELDLEHQLNLNLVVIQKQYASYVDCIQSIVEVKGVSAKHLSSYLLNLPAFTKPDDKCTLQFFYDLKTELQGTNEVVDIFILLSSKCASFLDYNIFEMLLQKYGTDKDKKELNYPEHLKAYIEQHKIKEFFKLNPKLINPKLQELDSNSKKITIKFNTKRTQSLSTLKEVTGAVANVLGVRPSALRLCCVKKGCVLVTLLIPTSIADVLFTNNTVLSPEQERGLKAASVLWFECNGHKFNFRQRIKKDQSQNIVYGQLQHHQSDTPRGITIIPYFSPPK